MRTIVGIRANSWTRPASFNRTQVKSAANDQKTINNKEMLI